MTNTENNNTKLNKFNRTHHGFNVQVCRFIRKCKQQTLAEHLGVCKKTMSKIESNAVIDDEILTKIGEFLNFSIDFMKELNDDSQVKVINVNEGGKLFTDESQNRDKNYEANSKDESTTNIGVPIEDFNALLNKFIAEKNKVAKLREKLAVAQYQLNNKPTK